MNFDTIKHTTFFALLLGTTITFIWMLGHYLLPVFWAVVIAIIFFPLYKNIEHQFNDRRSLASLTTIATIIVVVAIPLTIIGTMIVQESLSLYDTITNNESSSGIALLDRVTQFTAYLEPFGVSESDVTSRIRDLVASGLEVVSSSLLSATQSTFSFFISLAVSIYLLFFMFKDGRTLEHLLYTYIPLENTYKKRLIDRFTATTRAVAKGTIAIAILQGVLGGITFWISGVSAPTLWGAAMAVLAIIPAIGPALIWFPAGVILLATGSIWQGIFILVVGALLVSVVDEFLRPILIGRESKMPDAIILLATLGGLTTFGITGFIIGPIIAAFFISLWVIFEEKYHTDLSRHT